MKRVVLFSILAGAVLVTASGCGNSDANTGGVQNSGAAKALVPPGKQGDAGGGGAAKLSTE